MSSSATTDFSELLNKQLFRERYFDRILHYFQDVARDQTPDDLLLLEISHKFIKNEILRDNGLIEQFWQKREDLFEKNRQVLQFRQFLMEAVLTYWKREFCVIYDKTILKAFQAVAKSDANEHLLNDLKQDFLINKIMKPGGLIESYLKKIASTKPDEAEIPFLAYLKRAVFNAWQSHLRRGDQGLPQAKDPNQNPILNVAGAVSKPEKIDPEVLYAYALLNRVLSQVRTYCRRTKKMEQNWAIFDELVLAPLDETRKPRTREELRELYFPEDDDNQRLFNALTTITRLIDRHMRTLFHGSDNLDGTPKARFETWLSDLRESNSQIHGAIQQAIRISEEAYLPQQGSALSSMLGTSLPPEVQEADLGFGLYLRKSLPILEWSEWLHAQELLALLPPKSPFRPGQRAAGLRPLTLEMLMAPTPAEREELQKVDVAQVLRLVKNLSKLICQRRDGGFEPQIFNAVRTLAITIARVVYGQTITRLPVDEHKEAVLKLKSSRWLDDETRAFLNKSLRLGGVWQKP